MKSGAGLLTFGFPVPLMTGYRFKPDETLDDSSLETLRIPFIYFYHHLVLTLQSLGFYLFNNSFHWHLCIFIIHSDVV